MPANDEPPTPSRRRALGRGPGATRPAGPEPGSPAPPLPETGGESPDPATHVSPGGPVRAGAEAGVVGPVVDSPAPPLPETGGESPDPAATHVSPGREDGPVRAGAGGEAPGPGVHAVPGGAGGPVRAGVGALGEAPETETHASAGGAGGLESAEAAPHGGGPGPDAAGVGGPDGVGAPRGRGPEPEAPVPRVGGPGGDVPEPEARVPQSGGPAGAEGGGAGGDAAADGGGFRVRLVNFEGPFDLLLQLISKHKLDVTEVALSRVTDEFMAYIRAMGPDWDLDQTTEFLVVAATLLDLKAARLLPAAEVEDEADLALLEARDLLFARLLQYRAYKQIAEIFDRRLDDEARRFPRTVGLEPHLAELLPEVVISIGAEGFAKLAVKAMQPRPKPQVYVDHIHAPLVSVREQAEVVVAMLKARGRASFRELTEGAADTLTVVARFLALLELYREKAVALDQEDALGELTVVWAAESAQTVTVTDEFDQVVEEKR
ncbi:segregation/condensation protein A [Streptomyces sp. NPDC048389]|uniref:segregation/condensation protein A n=1 Tax=Streptomyces sp. NPDC048389 TaxID=3154622 RepID=UPI0034552EC6